MVPQEITVAMTTEEQGEVLVALFYLKFKPQHWELPWSLLLKEAVVLDTELVLVVLEEMVQMVESILTITQATQVQPILPWM